MNVPNEKSESTKQFVDIVNRNDHEALPALFEENPDLREWIDAPLFAFDSPAIIQAKHNIELVKSLVALGANINVRSTWWAGGFGILDGVSMDHAEQLIELGAVLDIHSACALGKIDDVRLFLKSNPEQVHARGGDGQLPLHLASSIELIDLLIDHGAQLEARDLDHSATAAQYQVDQPKLCKHLLDRGAQPDIFLATALGDRQRVSLMIESDPTCLNRRIGKCDATKPVDERSHHHIYFWKLKQAETPLEVANQFGHTELYDLIDSNSKPTVRMIGACWRCDERLMQKLLIDFPDLVNELDLDQKKDLARAAWLGKTEVVRLMLEAGFDPHVAGEEQSTPLDRASFHGYREIVELLLEHDPDPPFEQKNKYGGTPLSACIFGSVHSWIKDSDHLGTARALIEAGAPFDLEWIPTVNPRMDELLQEMAQ